ncbi:IclR family transcriptional regulator [Lentibacillus sp. N15]|uniref:IclR family transcriptional regulator n=1 Tax=Lentibacillus songyuanensis TaxID=3136161 RepID=UPI0031BAF0BD
MQSIDRAMKIVNVIMSHETTQLFSITDLAKECELPISSIHRILKSMIKHGMIQQDPDRKLYGLGPIWLEYGLKVYDTMDYISIVRPELEHLMQILQASVYLTKPLGDESIIMERIDCVQQTIRVHDQLGLRIPMNIGAANLTMLAHMPEDRKMEQFQHLSAEDQTAMLGQLEKIKSDGYSVCHNEQLKGITSVAVPILNRFREVEGAVSVRLVSFQLADENLDYVVENIVHTGNTISRKLGFPSAK